MTQTGWVVVGERGAAGKQADRQGFRGTWRTGHSAPACVCGGRGGGGKGRGSGRMSCTPVAEDNCAVGGICCVGAAKPPASPRPTHASIPQVHSHTLNPKPLTQTHHQDERTHSRQCAEQGNAGQGIPSRIIKRAAHVVLQMTLLIRALPTAPASTDRRPRPHPGCGCQPPSSPSCPRGARTA